MVQIRLVRPSRSEFSTAYYQPGVISLSRIVWGSIGGGMLLLIIAVFSQTTGVGVLYPPLAATCFINATCVFLRVARPKSVIVGHFLSTIGGLLAVYIGEAYFADSEYFLPIKLGLAVMLAAILMQAFDADHPPAAATAAIPALFPIIPRPSSDLVLPIHMAWGGVIAIIFAFIWNRMWFDWPTDGKGVKVRNISLLMDRPDFIGTVIAITGFVFMCFKPLSELVYQIGLVVMLISIIILSLHHFFTAQYITGLEHQ